MKTDRRRLLALVRKEFIELRRDRRTLAMIIAIPLLFLLVFGYAASFDVKHVGVELAGRDSPPLRAALRAQGSAFDVRSSIAPDVAAARSDLRAGRETLAVLVAPSGGVERVLVDGSNLLVAQTALRNIERLQTTRDAARLPIDVLYNPTLRSANFMVPGLVGLIMAFIGIVITALGVVRERERGTLEQLMVTPITRLELMLGKLIPYLLIAFVDLAIIIGVGLTLFSVPLHGSIALLLLLSLLFLISTLGIGLLISTVSENQQQAMQLAVMVLLPQVLLSGWIFPLSSIPAGVRWLSYIFPLTYFLPISRGIFLKGLGIPNLWVQTVVLVGMAVVIVTLAASRVSKQLA
jgi:ABC-2 type transport system permease protein